MGSSEHPIPNFITAEMIQQKIALRSSGVFSQAEKHQREIDEVGTRPTLNAHKLASMGEIVGTNNPECSSLIHGGIALSNSIQSQNGAENSTTVGSFKAPSLKFRDRELNNMPIQGTPRNLAALEKHDIQNLLGFHQRNTSPLSLAYALGKSTPDPSDEKHHQIFEDKHDSQSRTFAKNARTVQTGVGSYRTNTVKPTAGTSDFNQ